MKKRGISGVVVTVLLVLVAIVAIAIVWQLIRGLFNPDIETGTITTNLKIQYAHGYPYTEVKVKRNIGVGNLVKIKFIFENKEESYIEAVNSSMKELESQNFSFDLTGKILNITKVSVAPVIKTEKGKEVTGRITDTYIISGWVACVPDCAGKECGDDGCLGSCGDCDPGEDCTNGLCQAPAQPQINLVLNYPTSDINVQRNTFFNFSVNISCLNADCGSINVSLDPSATITLNYGNLTDDAYGAENGPNDGPYHIFFKWGITSIPASSTIDDGTLCMWIRDKMGALSPVVNVSYINNQTWRETVSLPTLTQLNQTQATLSSTTEGTWSCFNVTTQLRQAFANGNKNMTIRLVAANRGTTNNLIVDSTFLKLGDEVVPDIWLFFNSSETSSGKPYLNITYTLGELATPKTGLISTTTGDTPFYTNENPKLINLNKSQNLTITWNINATGSLAGYDFFAYANLSSNPGINAKTSKVKITIIP